MIAFDSKMTVKEAADRLVELYGAGLREKRAFDIGGVNIGMPTGVGALGGGLAGAGLGYYRNLRENRERDPDDQVSPWRDMLTGGLAGAGLGAGGGLAVENIGPARNIIHDPPPGSPRASVKKDTDKLIRQGYNKPLDPKTGNPASGWGWPAAALTGAAGGGSLGAIGRPDRLPPWLPATEERLANLKNRVVGGDAQLKGIVGKMSDGAKQTPAGKALAELFGSTHESGVLSDAEGTKIDAYVKDWNRRNPPVEPEIPAPKLRGRESYIEALPPVVHPPSPPLLNTEDFRAQYGSARKGLSSLKDFETVRRPGSSTIYARKPPGPHEHGIVRRGLTGAVGGGLLGVGLDSLANFALSGGKEAWPWGNHGFGGLLQPAESTVSPETAQAIRK